jgi:ABC-type transport system involved in Fe-S cluster assembly fused permease/ATPase subunit
MKKEILKSIYEGHCSITLPIILAYIFAFMIFGLSMAAAIITTTFAWLFWSIYVPKWKLKSIQKLQSASDYLAWNSKAITNGLIWPDSSFLSKTEIWNEEDQQLYLEIKNELLNNSSVE